MKIEKPVRQPGIVAKEIGGETLLYNAEEEVIHVLNPTAKLIWELCDGEYTITDMEHMLRTNFAVPDEHDVATDIQQTLAIFSKKGLLQPIE